MRKKKREPRTHAEKLEEIVQHSREEDMVISWDREFEEEAEESQDFPFDFPSGVNGHWVWRHGVDGQGYPRLIWRGALVSVAQVIYQLWWNVERVPPNFTVKVRCGEKRCASPIHTELVRRGRLSKNTPLARGKTPTKKPRRKPTS